MERKDLFISSCLVLLYLSVAIYCLPSTGLTWDESRYQAQAKARAYSIYAFISGNPDLPFCDLKTFFGGLPEENNPNNEFASRCWEGRPKLPITLSGLTWAMAYYAFGGTLTVLQSIFWHRIAIVLMIALALFITYFFLKDTFNRRTAIFSLISIIVMPRLFGESLFVLMDAPVILFWIATLFFFWKGLKNWKYAILSGVAWGLAISTIDMALFIPVALLFWLIISYRKSIRKEKLTKLIPKANVFSFLVIAPLILILVWPWLWYDTLPRLSWEVWYYMHHIEGGLPPVYFLGQSVYYPDAVYTIALTLSVIPVGLLILVAFGTFNAIKDTIFDKNKVSMLILLSALTPILVLSLLNLGYNGVQHYIESFFFIGILAGIGADRICDMKIFRRNSAIAIIIALIMLSQIVIELMGHSDAYFNELVGYTQGVDRSGIFETEWSGESYLQAVYWLNDNAKPNSTVYVPMAINIFNVYKYGDIGLIAHRLDTSSINFNFRQQALLRGDINITDNSSVRADYLVLMWRKGLFVMPEYYNSEIGGCVKSDNPIYSVTENQGKLTSIYELPCKSSISLSMEIRQ